MTRLIALTVTAAVVGCSETALPPAGTADATPATVTVAAAAEREMPRLVEAGGVVRAHTTATIASRILAPVRAVHVTAGDRVTAGQTLVVLDSGDLDAARSRAAVTVTALEYRLAATAAERDAAGAALTLARATHGRVDALHGRRAATRQELDDATSALQAAEARLRAAEASVAGASASLDAARADAAGAAATAAFAVVTAPFSGVVTETLADEGDLAVPGAPLVRLDDTRRFELEVHVDESVVPLVSRGQAASVSTGEPNHGGEEREVTLDGRVREVARATTAGAHTFLVTIDLPAHPSLRSGLFGRARLTTGTRRRLAVPEAAIVPRGQLALAFVNSGGRAQLRMLRTGESAGGWVEVLAGLVSGELVIVSPPPGLRDGDSVAPAETGGAR